MADWTLRNLKDDVENSAETYGMGPDLETRFGRRELELEGGGFSYQRLAPNYAIPFGHRHQKQEEVFLVLAGSGRAKLDGEVRELKQWDALRLPPAVMRGFAAGPDGMELLVIGFGDGGDTEMLDGYWDEA
jgi:mannose-6-phosphate isomerase-like protein (cupin superfamily)